MWLLLLCFSASVLLSPDCSAQSYRYDRLIKDASDRNFGLQSDWAWHKARVRVESNFDTSAVSKAGAAGIAQFIPATAFEYGAKTLAERFDATWSINSMVRYIKDIWNYIDSRTDTALTTRNHQMFSDAGYNWGMGRVVKTMRKAGHTWEDIVPFLPKETQLYSPLIQLWKRRYLLQ